MNFIDRKFAEKREKFMSRFKKPYEERTTAENIIVEGLRETLFIGGTTTREARYLGAIEAILVIEGFLKPGQKWNYEKKEYKFLFWKYSEKESYKTLIIRLGEKYLTEKGVM